MERRIQIFNFCCCNPEQEQAIRGRANGGDEDPRLDAYYKGLIKPNDKGFFEEEKAPFSGKRDKPDNAHFYIDLTDEKNIESVKKIEDHFKEFLRRKDNLPENDFGFKIMTSPSTDRHLGGKKYYFSAQQEVSYLSTPENIKINGAKGVSKTLTRSDEHFVQLENKSISLEVAKAVNSLVKELSSFPSVCLGYYVEQKEMDVADGTKVVGIIMIARNGGSEVFSEVMEEGNIIPLKAFKAICEDQVKMHEQHIFMRDIKPQNIVVKNNIAMFIDLDSAITPNYGDRARKCGTPGYTTIVLRDMNAYKSSDQFALLNTLMFATGSKDLALMIDKNRLNTFKSNGVAIGKLHEKWIKQYIKPEYKKTVKKFLQAPFENPLNVSIDSVIKWNG